jgi:hypothetical protein
MIGRLDLDTKLKIFRAKTNWGFTFLMSIARRDSSRFRAALDMTREFPLEIRRKILTERDVDGCNLPMVAVAGISGGILFEPVMDAMQELGSNVTEEVFLAEGRLGWSFRYLWPDTLQIGSGCFGCDGGI